MRQFDQFNVRDTLDIEPRDSIDREPRYSVDIEPRYSVDIEPRYSVDRTYNGTVKGVRVRSKGFEPHPDVIMSESAKIWLHQK